MLCFCLVFHFAQCCMVCTVIAFNFCLHGENHTISTSTVLNKLTYLATAPFTHITHLISGFHKDNLSNITCSPPHGPSTHPQCKPSILVEQTIFVIFHILYLVSSLLDSFSVLGSGFFLRNMFPLWIVRVQQLWN